MDSLTHQYYFANAEKIFEQYSQAEGGVSELFAEAFPDKEGYILDIGAGTGREVDRLLSQGYEVWGVEPVDELRTLAIEKRPSLKDRLFQGSLPELSCLDTLPEGKKFTGILCSAVFQHLRRDELFDAMFAVKNLLEPNGRLLLSLPASRPNRKSEERDENDRLFIMHSPGEIELLLTRLGFEKIKVEPSNDALGRRGVTWTNMIFELRHSEAARPIDQVEAILNRDKKSATYKPALLRALCDIARENQKLVNFVSGFDINQESPKPGVHIPLSAIAEKWLSYYYPILNYPEKIPQTNNPTKDMAFKDLLEELVGLTANSGGYPVLQNIINGSTSSSATDALETKLKQTLKKIGDTIVKGPVTFAGVSTAGEPTFSYDPSTKSVVASPEIWRELTLMGHWIGDSLLLRWAELSEKMASHAGSGIKKGEILSVLLESHDPQRDVSLSRNTFAALPSLECVWSSRSLKSEFEVDHVIAWSLWHNNDLWNLLPVDGKINNAKRDKLPEHALLKKRKEAILHYWEIIRQSHPGRFFSEARKFAGPGLAESNWQTPLFSALVEAVETTALQRGVERWAV